ncbi:MAG: SWIM zinc finger family protein [Candidatus Marinimicrobia bacterium]|nr:SWIM zinc finger family protein [Candidatus Neomarinimicrobiota bacterium]MCF7827794.1 SWIM zinc finger family protein [Candidatus Neomarinimicrobiota bacterium]MCF7879451.1 SWIM zinc finger family protein [Candidatus Neomarinimicrobiota bacterium]
MPLPNLTLTNFTGEVSSTIVDRGQDYFYRDLVTSLEESLDGQWVAQVRGTATYTVEISLSNDVVASWACTCPYDYGPVCKHVVAVLMELKEGKSAKADPEQKKRSTRKSPERRFDSLVDDLPVDALRKFLRDYAQFHPEMEREFLAKFTTADVPDAWRDYVAVIRESARAGSDRHGFIKYSNSFRVMQPIHTMIQQAYEKLESAEYHAAWHIARAVVQEVPKLIQRMDDSSGDGGFVTNNALEILREAGTATEDDDLQSEIFQFLLKEYPKQQYSDFGFDETILSVLTALIRNPRQAKQVERLIKAQLEAAENAEDDFGFDYRFQRALKHQIEFLEQTGREDEAADIIDAHLDIEEFRERRIQEAFDQEDFDTAKSLVRDGIKLIREQKYPPGYEYRWEQWLFRIAKAEEDTENIRQYARFFFLHRRQDISWYKELRSTYTDQEWRPILADLIEEIRSKSYFPARALAEVYAYEHHWDDLLQLLSENPDLSLLKEYGTYLREDFPEDLLAIYGETLRAFAAEYTGRKYYREIVRTLNNIRDISGGADFVRNLVAEFRETYNRRPAMQEELDKVKA